MTTYIDQIDRIIANLTVKGWSRDRIHAFAGRVRKRLFERGQSGAHVWGLVFNATR